MTKLSKTYLGFSPGSRPARSAALGATSREPPGPPEPARRSGRPGRRAARRPTAPPRHPSRDRRSCRRRAPPGRCPRSSCSSPRGRRGPPRRRRRSVDRAQLPGLGVRTARPGRGVPVPGRRRADGVGADTERAATVVGAVAGGPVLLGALRLGRRPGPAGGLLDVLRLRRIGGRVLELHGDADVPAELLRQRLGQHPAHPRLEDGLGELVRGGEHGGVLDQAQRPGEVQHRVLLRGQAGGQPLTDLVPDRRQVQRGIGHAARPPVASSPRPLPDTPVSTAGSTPTVDTRTLAVHTAVHRLCTAGGDLHRLHARRASTGIAAGQRPFRAGDRAVRRSADRRGRPARRDPDVRRGATATLTAPSTARQRCPGGAGR